MKRRLSILSLVAMVGLTAVPARAEVLDMSTLKCSDIASWSTDEAALVMFWLHGYYGGQAGDTKVDFQALQNVSETLGTSCAESPDLGIMTVLKSIVGQ